MTSGSRSATSGSAIVRPAGATGVLPTILYIHGAGWVFGNAHTHDRLVRELAVGTGAAVVFPEYSLSPEARYPVAIEQEYTVARWISTEGATKQLDPERLVIAGDSVGGNMAAALTIMAKQRRPATRPRTAGRPHPHPDRSDRRHPRTHGPPRRRRHRHRRPAARIVAQLEEQAWMIRVQTA